MDETTSTDEKRAKFENEDLEVKRLERQFGNRFDPLRDRDYQIDEANSALISKFPPIVDLKTGQIYWL
ncbi:MAG: hypothetical protein MHPSP_002855 [Paramarteilia canceri]